MVNDLEKFINKRWLILAPMAGVNDLIFRQICIENGAMLTYTEMVSSKALSYKNDKTSKLLELSKIEDKVVVQLFGHEPKVMASESEKLQNTFGNKLAYIDINMGCPAKKIAKKGDGAALMTRPNLATEIVRACVSSCDIPITVKFRRGYNLGEDISQNFAELIEKAGASAMCVHGRYAMQFYKDKADFNVVKKIKLNSNIPIIWSGDISSFKQAKKIKDEGIDGVMIGRAARGNPWVFSKKINNDIYKKIATARRHVIEYAKINKSGLSHMRKHCMWYCTGMPGASFARNKFSSCVSVDDYLKVFNKLEERIK